jgi:hypothetical protein
LPIQFTSLTPEICSVEGTTITALAPGIGLIAADQPGDGNFNPALQVIASLVIGRIPATVTLDGLSQVYDGTPRAATATTDPADKIVRFSYTGRDGTVYGPSATPPTPVGSYTVVATLDDETHAGSASGTLVVAKVAATITLGNLDQTYDGGAKTATAATSPEGLVVTLSYDGSPTPPVAAGSYAVAATIADPNHTGTAAGTLTVRKRAASVILGNLTHTYDGTPRSATVTTHPAGLTANLLYDRSGTAPTAVGTYIVDASITNPDYQAETSAVLSIGKASQSITFDGLPEITVGTSGSLTATATSGQPVVFRSLKSDICVVAGNTVYGVAAGTATIVADQPGNDNFSPAAQVFQTLTVNPASPDHDIGLWSDALYRDTEFTAAMSVISTAAQLAQFAWLVNHGETYAGRTVSLANDIDLAAHEWVPAGTNPDTCFEGSFDGAGFTVRNILIDQPGADYQGLFGCVGTTGAASNLTVADLEIDGRNYVGGIAGYVFGSITDCAAEAPGTVSGSDNVAGVAGVAHGAVSNCSNSSAVSGSHVGGILSRLASGGTLLNSENRGSVTGTAGAGGIVRSVEIGSIMENCLNTGEVSGPAGATGGLLGMNRGTLKNSYWKQTGVAPFNLVAVADSGGSVSGIQSFGSAPGTLALPVTVGEVTTEQLSSALNAWVAAAWTSGCGLLSWTAGTATDYPSLGAPLEIWAAANGLTDGVNDGVSDDPDADGLSNLQEFAFGTDPTDNFTGSITYEAGGSVTTPGQPVAINLGSNGVVDVRVVFGRRKDWEVAGLTYTVRFSVDMTEGSWVSSSATPIRLTGPASLGGIDAVSVAFPNYILTPHGPRKPRFAQVVVSQTP